MSLTGWRAALLAAAMAAGCARPEPAPPAISHPDIVLEADSEIIPARVPVNATLGGMLRPYGLHDADITGVVDAVTRVFDVRKLHQGQPWRVERTHAGCVRLLEYEVDPEHYVSVTPVDGSAHAFEATVLAYDVTRERAIVEVSIDAATPSLFGAMDAAGERPDLPIALAEIFGGEIDFNSELQPGDRFRLLVEKVNREGRLVRYGPVLAAEILNDGRSLTAVRFAAPGQPAGYFDAAGRSLKRFFLRSPLKFEPQITSRFSAARLHPVLHTVRAHLGVDYRAPVGAPVVAVAGGTVVQAGFAGGGGRTVGLRHAGGYETYYLHLSSIAVRPGAHVSQGQVIGRVGQSGLATGPHLDYRIKKNGAWVNPVLEHRRVPPGDPVPADQMAAYAEARSSLLGELGPLAVGSPADRRHALTPARAALGRGARPEASPRRRTAPCSLASRFGHRAGPAGHAETIAYNGQVSMAVLHPFRALRPRPDQAAAVAAVPYDVVSTDEARSSPPGIRSASCTCRAPRSTCRPTPIRMRRRRLRDGRAATSRGFAAEAPLVQEAEPSVYFYRLRMGGHEQTGLAACFSVDEYDSDVIQKHERTRRDKEDDRTRHIVELRAQTGPVFLTYVASRDVDAVAARVTGGAPLFDFTRRDGVQHTVWRVPDADAAAARRRVRADARCSTSPTATTAPRAPMRARQVLARATGSAGPIDADTFLAVAFPHDQAQILPYNRVVKDLAGRLAGRVPRRGARRGAPSADGTDAPARQGRRRDVPRGTLVRARRSGSPPPARRRPIGSTWRCCRTRCSRRCSASAIRAPTSASTSSAGSAGPRRSSARSTAARPPSRSRCTRSAWPT